jgi:hypothetical protein
MHPRWRGWLEQSYKDRRNWEVAKKRQKVQREMK